LGISGLTATANFGNFAVTIAELMGERLWISSMVTRMSNAQNTLLAPGLTLVQLPSTHLTPQSFFVQEIPLHLGLQVDANALTDTLVTSQLIT